MAINNIPRKCFQYLNKGSDRTIIIKKNIAQSFVYKFCSILLSLLIVPLTINFVNPEQYGIWLTVSSIVAWISYFDLGLGNGLRNKFAEAKAVGNNKLASKYISTSYFLFGVIFSVIFITFLYVNQYIDWNELLKIRTIDSNVLKNLMNILTGLFCINMFLKVLNSVLLGDQKTGLSSGVSVLGQLLSLISIYYFSQYYESSLSSLAFIYFGVPNIVLLLTTLYVFSFKKFSIYRIYRPTWKNIDLHLTKSLLFLGGKFFLIQVSLIIIFQCINVIISRNIGQIAVTQYNISYKYFHIVYMISVILLTPFWSAFTDAFTKKDYKWMENANYKLNRATIYLIPLQFIMLILSPWFFKVWIGNTVTIPFSMSIFMSVYIITMSYAGLQMYILNGIGKITIQFIIYSSFSIFAIPIMNILSKLIGIYGILIFLTLVYFIQAVVGKIQINKIIRNKAFGIWDK